MKKTFSAAFAIILISFFSFSLDAKSNTQTPTKNAPSTQRTPSNTGTYAPSFLKNMYVLAGGSSSFINDSPEISGTARFGLVFAKRIMLGVGVSFVGYPISRSTLGGIESSERDDSEPEFVNMGDFVIETGVIIYNKNLFTFSATCLTGYGFFNLNQESGGDTSKSTGYLSVEPGLMFHVKIDTTIRAYIGAGYYYTNEFELQEFDQSDLRRPKLVFGLLYAAL